MIRGLKVLLGAGVVVLALLVGLFLFQVPISNALIDRQIASILDRDVLESLPDGLHVGLCGSGGPFPNRDRRASCVPVYGPRGAETVVEGLRQAYSLDALYRTAHHGAAIAPPEGAGRP